MPHKVKYVQHFQIKIFESASDTEDLDRTIVLAVLGEGMFVNDTIRSQTKLA